MFHFTALVTCLAVALYFFTSIQVAKARATFGIKVPAVTGNPEFERIFRVLGALGVIVWRLVHA